MNLAVIQFKTVLRGALESRKRATLNLSEAPVTRNAFWHGRTRMSARADPRVRRFVASRGGDGDRPAWDGNHLRSRTWLVLHGAPVRSVLAQAIMNPVRVIIANEISSIRMLSLIAFSPAAQQKKTM